MSFLEPSFFVFFILFAGLYFFSRRDGIPPKTAFVVLVAGSALFYSFSRPSYLLLLLGDSAVAWISGILLTRKPGHRRLILWTALLLLLAPLFVFKYYNFFISNARWLGLFSGADMSGLVLPLGISFFTFQSISYVSDVYRGMPCEKSPLRYFVYSTFFPHLAAGPIVTARTFLPQLNRLVSLKTIDFQKAAFFLLSGFIKKAFFADRLALIADPIFAHPNLFSPGELLLGNLAYSFQIYFDFSGYSDIAIGLAALLGYDLPENFNFPYSAAGFRDFWRRWHITLSSWLRDHIYIPLGGSRRGPILLGISLVATMGLGGLWHGAHWNFVIWGLLHGLLLIADRFVPDRFRTQAASRFFLQGFTFIAVTLLWVFFRSGSTLNGWENALYIYSHMPLVFQNPGSVGARSLAFVLISGFLVFISSIVYEKLRMGFLSLEPVPCALWCAVGTLLLVLFSPGSDSFLYFVF